MKLFLLICCLSFILSSCSSVSERAYSAFEWGDWHHKRGNYYYEKACKISFENRLTDPTSMYNLGVCYKNGVGGYEKDLELAKSWFISSAKYGLDEAAENLKKLGEKVPSEYYETKREAQRQFIIRQQESEKRSEKLAAIATAFIVGSAQAAAEIGSEMNSSSNLKDYSGCCSYHSGILTNSGQVYCANGFVMCADRWISSCTCY